MKCLNDCGKEAVGRSKYCSDSCKVLYNRKRKHQSVNSEAVNRKQPDTAPTTQTLDEHEPAQCVKSDEVIVQQPENITPEEQEGIDLGEMCNSIVESSEAPKSDRPEPMTEQEAREKIKKFTPEMGKAALAQWELDRLSRTASYQDYLDNPDDYCARQEPKRMNWGAWLNMDELKFAGLKCNRVAIPGDWDYTGVVQPTTAAPVDEHSEEAEIQPVSI